MSDTDHAATTTADTVAYHHLAETPWERPADAPPELRALADKAAEVGARRAQITKGMIGLHSQLSEMPPGYEVPPHRHTAHELMIVLEGGCSIHGGPQLTAGDMAEIPGNTEYGFTVGDEGIRFLVVRPDVSTTHIS